MKWINWLMLSAGRLLLNSCLKGRKIADRSLFLSLFCLFHLLCGWTTLTCEWQQERCYRPACFTAVQLFSNAHCVCCQYFEAGETWSGSSGRQSGSAGINRHRVRQLQWLFIIILLQLVWLRLWCMCWQTHTETHRFRQTEVSILHRANDNTSSVSVGADTYIYSSSRSDVLI